MEPPIKVVKYPPDNWDWMSDRQRERWLRRWQACTSKLRRPTLEAAHEAVMRHDARACEKCQRGDVYRAFPCPIAECGGFHTGHRSRARLRRGRDRGIATRVQ